MDKYAVRRGVFLLVVIGGAVLAVLAAGQVDGAARSLLMLLAFAALCLAAGFVRRGKAQTRSRPSTE